MRGAGAKRGKSGNRGFEKARAKKRELVEKEITKLQSLYSQIDSSAIKAFTDFPLSDKTQKGLADSDYKVPTEIQRECINLALKGFDVLGAAQTGSGKTLAFIIPILELLYCNKWSSLDGLGALVISPTRELALQSYETLRKVGRYHDFSAGLIIGGKDLVFEKDRIHQVNIMICTPGRLLQHMDENPLFNCTSMKILILDEADRCLDLGFEQTMNAIIENLPAQHQTLLFSATQTKSMKDLIRLSLKDPKYVSVHENAKYRTPDGLTQSAVFCEQHEKMAVVWSFIKTHLKQKVIVFLTSCQQVSYMYNILCKLHPRVTLLALYGRLNQQKRMNIYQTFCNKQHAFLFATDIAARGLDFPSVNWVVQLDCPESVETYIHRAGRTARYQKGGECLLVLRPSERTMLGYLQNNKIPIEEIKINPSRIFSPQAKIEAFLASNQQLKENAKRAFVGYCKSVYMMKDKTVFDVKSIDHEKYARSLGLAVSPRIRFLQKVEKAKQQKEERKKLKAAIQEGQKREDNDDENSASDDDEEEDDEEEDEEDGEVESDNENEEESEEEDNTAAMKTCLADKINTRGSFHFYNDSDNEDDVLTLKRRHEELGRIGDDEELPQPESKKKKKPVTKAALAKRLMKKNIAINKKIQFTEEGEAVLDKMKEKVSDAGRNYDANVDEGGINIDEAKQMMKEEDRFDRKLFREKVKARKRALKQKLKEERTKGLKTAKGTDEFGAKLDMDSGGSEPDLSWLPDPDVIYSKKNNDSDDDEGNRESDGEANKFESDEDSSASDSEIGNSDLTVKEQEEIALKLLSK